MKLRKPKRGDVDTKDDYEIGLETLVVSKKEDWCSCESKVDAGYRKNGWIVCGRCSKLVGGAPV